jgi:hypothetical protein
MTFPRLDDYGQGSTESLIAFLRLARLALEHRIQAAADMQ